MLQLTTIFFVISLGLLALLHYLALEFFLYWRFIWIDLVMHFFGGAVVALGCFTLKDFIRGIPVRFLYVVPVISAVLIVSLLWEIFEIYIGVPVLEPGFGRDAIFDILSALLGGFVGFVVGHSIRKL